MARASRVHHSDILSTPPLPSRAGLCHPDRLHSIKPLLRTGITPVQLWSSATEHFLWPIPTRFSSTRLMRRPRPLSSPGSFTPSPTLGPQKGLASQTRRGRLSASMPPLLLLYTLAHIHDKTPTIGHSTLPTIPRTRALVSRCPAAQPKD